MCLRVCVLKYVYTAKFHMTFCCCLFAFCFVSSLMKIKRTSGTRGTSVTSQHNKLSFKWICYVCIEEKKV